MAEADYRRKRSLKFRAKMRAWRSKVFNDPFHKKNRTIKNENKVIAAKRRKRDDTGKFNYELNKEALNLPIQSIPDMTFQKLETVAVQAAINKP